MKSNLYTGTGDSGTTSLVGGQRVSKTSLRLEAYGTLDEFSSFLGVVASDSDCPDCLKRQLESVQQRLFDAGCYLATAVNEGDFPACNGIDESCVAEVESWIDALDASVPKIQAFVLPGGTQLSSRCHVARTVCRRAERRVLSLSSEEYVDPVLIRWMNRLSDYLFIAARYVNHILGIEETVWRPAAKK